MYVLIIISPPCAHYVEFLPVSAKSRGGDDVEDPSDVESVYDEDLGTRWVASSSMSFGNRDAQSKFCCSAAAPAKDQSNVGNRDKMLPYKGLVNIR